MVINGTVQNARTNIGIVGATVRIFCGSREVNTSITGSGGNFSAPVKDDGTCGGQFIVRAENSGFCSSVPSQDVSVPIPMTVSCQTITLASAILLTPQPPPGQFVIVLTWGNSPPDAQDLDAHVKRNGGLHLAWNQGTDGASPPFPPPPPRKYVSYGTLDVDDTSFNGPETITINQQINRRYRYFVHQYGGAPGVFPASGARVRFWNSSCMDIYYDASSAGGSPVGPYWRVFDMPANLPDNVAPTTVNTLVGAEPGSPP
jgi:hypothetical protein